MTLSLCLLAAVALGAIAALAYTISSKPAAAAPAPTLIGRLMVVHQAEGQSVRGLLQTDLQASVASGWVVLARAEYLHAGGETTKAPAAVRIPVRNVTTIQDLAPNEVSS